MIQIHTRYRTGIGGAICAAAVVLAPMTGAQPAAPASAAELSLMKAEDQLLQAEARHDLAGIAQGFADEAVFVHGNGTTQTKSEYLQVARGSAMANGSITTAGRVVLVSGNMGVTRGKLNVVAGELHLPGLYLAVYVKRDGRWQLLDWQTSPAPQTAGSK